MIGHTSKASNVSSSGLPFLGLPPEMRNAIYEFWAAEYLKYRDPILIRSGPLKFQVIKGYPALLQTCKQINKEANDIFLKAVRLNVMPASEDHQVCIRGSPTRNMTRDVRNLKTRMSTWLKTNYDISLLVILFESKKIQRVVFKIGRDVFIWRRRKGGTRIGTTAKVDKPKRDGFNWVAYLGKIVLIWAYQSPYLLFMMYVVTRGGSAWERAKPRIW